MTEGAKPVYVDEFFEKNLVGNLAALLGIAKSQIRVVQIVKAQDGQSTRRRREERDDDMIITLEIADPPPLQIPYLPTQEFSADANIR